MPLYDAECIECGTMRESFLKKVNGKPPAKAFMDTCQTCGLLTAHERHTVNKPAKYMGEIQHNPRVFGGKFDTAGRAPLPDLPEIPGEKRWHDDQQTYVEHVPAEAVIEEYKKPETKEIVAERKEIMRRNRAKQARDAAINKGENINFGRQKSDRLPGDPKFT